MRGLHGVLPKLLKIWPYRGLYRGRILGVIEGDTRSSDYSSNILLAVSMNRGPQYRPPFLLMGIPQNRLLSVGKAWVPIRHYITQVSRSHSMFFHLILHE